MMEKGEKQGVSKGRKLQSRRRHSGRALASEEDAVYVSLERSLTKTI